MTEKILLARNGRLGDMVMVAPAVLEILKRHPEAEFTFLTSPDGVRLYKKFDPRITTFWINGTTPLTKRLLWIYYLFKIKQTKFSRAYCLDSDWKITNLLRKSAPYVTTIGVHPDKSVIHYALLALHSVGLNYKKLSNIPTPFIPVQSSSTIKLKKFLAHHKITDSSILVGLNPGFSGLKNKKVRKYKLWPIEHWAKLIDGLYNYSRIRNIQLQVVINSIPEESWIANEIAALCNTQPVLLTPKPDFELFKAYLNQLSLYVGPDTGATHLAAGLNTKLIALYSGTWLPGCGPIVSELSNSIISAEEINGSNSYLDSVTPESVLNLAKEKLDQIIKSGSDQ